MDKEKIVTIAIGLAVGITLAAAYFASGKLFPKSPTANTIITSRPTPQTGSPSALAADTAGLAVDIPADNTTTKDNPASVSGKTSPGSQVYIVGNAEEKIASADASGNFTSTIKLEDGDNQISFTTIDSQNKILTIIRDVVLEIIPQSP